MELLDRSDHEAQRVYVEVLKVVRWFGGSMVLNSICASVVNGRHENGSYQSSYTQLIKRTSVLEQPPEISWS
jgi:hypothetical protein